MKGNRSGAQRCPYTPFEAAGAREASQHNETKPNKNKTVDLATLWAGRKDLRYIYHLKNKTLQNNEIKFVVEYPSPLSSGCLEATTITFN